MRYSKLLVLFSSFALAACASAPAVQTASATRITAEEITNANVPTAYEAVDRLHRSWFRDLSGSAQGEVAVYIRNQKQDGGKEYLRQIPAQDVLLLEYLKATDAIMRFGQDAKGGAIIVTLK